jgi:hypothetical protein
MNNTPEQFLSNLIKEIVNNPNSVSVEQIEDERGIFLKLRVAPEDMSFVIGKKGVNANAIKLVSKLFGFKHGLRVSLKIEEPVQAS